jgi:hypothetical protein
MARTEIIRPAAVLPEQAAVSILSALRAQDVTRGGMWNATSALWQRYDRAWDVLTGLRGGAQLLGTIAVSYDTPTRFTITVYRVSVTEEGAAAGWTVERLCDDAFGYGGLTLATCPRAELRAPAAVDPFRVPRQAVDSPRSPIP